MVSSPQVAIATNIITIRSNKLRKSSQSLPTRIKKHAVVASRSVYPARREPQRPGTRRRRPRAEGHPQPDENQISTEDVERVARIQKTDEPPRWCRDPNEGRVACCLGRGGTAGRSLLYGKLLRIARSIQCAPPRRENRPEMKRRSVTCRRASLCAGDGDRFASETGLEPGSVPSPIIDIYDNCRKR